MKLETKLKILILTILIGGGLLLSGLMFLFSRWPIYTGIAIIGWFLLMVFASSIRMPKKKWAKKIYKSSFILFKIPVVIIELTKPTLGILCAYLFAMAISWIPALIIVGVYTIFAGKPPVELTVFICVGISTILLSNHTEFIKKILLKYGIWSVWDKNDRQRDFVVMGQFVLQSGNVHFIISLSYVVFLVMYALQSIMGYEPILTPSLNNAILKAFLVYIAYTTMVQRYNKQEMSMGGMTVEVLKMYHVPIGKEKQSDNEVKSEE